MHTEDFTVYPLFSFSEIYLCCFNVRTYLLKKKKEVRDQKLERKKKGKRMTKTSSRARKRHMGCNLLTFPRVLPPKPWGGPWGPLILSIHVLPF